MDSWILTDEAETQGPFVLPCDPAVAVEGETADRYLSRLVGISASDYLGAWRFYLRPLTNDDLIENRQAADDAVGGHPVQGAKLAELQKQARADGVDLDLDDDGKEALKTWRRWRDELADDQLRRAVELVVEVKVDEPDVEHLDVFAGFLNRLPRTMMGRARAQLLRLVASQTDLVPEGKARSWPRRISPRSRSTNPATNSTGGTAASATKTKKSGTPAVDAATGPSKSTAAQKRKTG